MVGEECHFPERNGVHHATMVTQPQRAHGYRFYRAPDFAHLDVFTHPKRIVEQKENPGDDVANQGLRAKADGNADHPGAGQQRPYVHP